MRLYEHDELYDLEKDPMEIKNLALEKEYAEIVENETTRYSFLYGND